MVSKVAQLSAIHTEIYNCTKCPLHAGRTYTVPGAGFDDAEIMFIGEAPGKNEDEQGLPFVGRSGQYLDELLDGIGLHRDAVFIANVIKCRPPDNNDPTSDQIETCNPYLRQQIEVIDPLVIATLGRFSMGMFFPNDKISRIHGEPKYGTRRAYLPLFHPAYVLRNGSKRPEMAADFDKLLLVLEEVKRRRESGEIAENPTQASVDEEISLPSDQDGPSQKSLFD